MNKLNNLTTENWNELIVKIGNIGDNTQNQLKRVQAHIVQLNGTLEITNIILTIIAITYITSTIIKFISFKKK